MTHINGSRSRECDFRAVSDPVAFLAAQCAFAWHTRAAAGLSGLFLLGLGGSLAHCGAMCGPLVAGQVADRLAAVPASRLCERTRVQSGLLLPYHAGRLTTYAALGALAGATGLAFVRTLAPLRSALLLLAAAALLAAAFGMLPSGQAAAWGPWRWARRINRGTAAGTYLFGLILGLLPCGLLYAALIAASSLASPWQGAAGMAAFGAGTVPILAMIGIAGRTRAVSTLLRRAAPVLLAFNAFVLVVAAVGGVLV